MNLVYTGVKSADIQFLFQHGFHLAETTQESQVQRFKKSGCSITLYASGKLLIQCIDADVSSYERMFAKFSQKQPKVVKALPTKSYDTLSVFGSDETLKGDTFGGLIVSGFSYSPELKNELLALGVKDSKLLTDGQILGIASQLEAQYPQQCVSIELDPQLYNTATQTKTITQVLNELHQSIATHKQKGQLHLVDAYPGCKVGDEAVTQAEGKSLAVAAASILARSKAVKQFERLSTEAGFLIPKGSTHVSVALDELKKRKLSPSAFVKLHFKNVQKHLFMGEDASLR
jgi:ribonuclease HIII